MNSAFDFLDDSFHLVILIKIEKNAQWKYCYIIIALLNMPFTDKQMFAAIEANADVKDCFEKITDACKALKIKTGCPSDDVDRFLEFTIGKWE